MLILTLIYHLDFLVTIKDQTNVIMNYFPILVLGGHLKMSTLSSFINLFTHFIFFPLRFCLIQYSMEIKIDGKISLYLSDFSAQINKFIN